MVEIETSVQLRIILVATPAGVSFGIQNGKGNSYTAIQVQQSSGNDLAFSCSVTVRNSRTDALPSFLGPLIHGPPTARFIYIDVGKLAGQIDSPWERRIKIPLAGITWDLIEQVANKPKQLLEASFPGTARDGGPSCATIRPTNGWTIRRQ